MVNKIWGFLIISGLLYAFLTDKILLINEVILESGKTTFNMIINILPVMALWLGIMKIASVSGLLNKFTNVLSPILRRIFPDLPKEHESHALIATSIIANAVGLGNAATPFGIKAMQSMQTLNNKKDTATKSMVTFLVITTAGFTLMPTTIIAMRILYQSINPTEILISIIIASLCATIGGLIMDRLVSR
jgi:spore maturation protein A